MEFRLLGDLQAWHEGRELELGGQRQKSVLAVLLLHPSVVVPTRRIVAYAWPGDAPATAEKLVTSYIAQLRQILNPAGGISLRSRAPGYLAEVNPELVDAHRFTALLDRARADRESDEEQAEALLRRALGLWRGAALADLDSPWLRARGLALEQSRLDAVAELAEIDLNVGRFREACALLRGPHAEHPEREHLAALLVRALDGAGEAAQATSIAATTIRALLALGLDPGPELRQAQQDALADGVNRPSHAVSARARRQLPAPTRAFTGRAEELRRLAGLAASTSGGSTGAVVITAIDGMGGVGKTSLALRAAHDVSARFPDGQLFIDLRGYTDGLDPLTADQALHSILCSLGVSPQHIPVDPQARTALYRDRLAGTRTLIVLDNAFNTAQVRPLLPGDGECLVVITSRRRLTGLDDAETLYLDVLPEADAIALFQRIAGPGLVSDGPVLAETVRLCGCLPLAIRIAAARLRHRRALRIDHLAQQLRDEHGRLGHLRDEDRSLAAVFELSYHHLPAVEQNLFRHLSFIWGPDFDAFAVANLAGIDVRSAEQLLESLLDQNLLVQRTPGRYLFHDLVRLFARTVEPGDADAPRGPRDRLFTYYLHATWEADRHFERSNSRPTTRAATPAPAVARSLSNLEEAKAWVATELPNLIAAVESAADRSDSSYAIDQPAALAQYLRIYGSAFQALHLHRVASEVARRVGDRAGQAEALTELANHQRLGDSSELAESAIMQALLLYRELDNRIGQAYALGHLALIERQFGKYAEAQESLAEALGIYHEQGDLLGQANILIQLGSVLSATGDFARSEMNLDQGLSIYRRLENRFGQAFALTEMGMALRLSGAFARAEEVLAEALTFNQETGNGFGQANTLTQLGVAQREIGKFAEAQDSLKHALDLYTSLGIRHGQANALAHLGEAERLTGAFEEAEKTLSRALDLYRALGSRLGLSNGLTNLAAVQLQTGVFASAEENLDQAILLYLELGDPGGRVTALNHYAALVGATRGLAQARDKYTEALGLAHEIRSQWDEANALDGIAATYLAEGSSAEAANHYQLALDLYRSIDCRADVIRVQAILKDM